MDFQTLYELYYTSYRGDSEVPASTDPEWTLAWRYYNDALNRMATFDDTKWNFLYTTLNDEEPTLIQTGVVDYPCPDNMAEPGGYVSIIDSNGNKTNIQVIQPHEAQSVTSTSICAYFTGDQNTGFTMHLNATPSATWVGKTIDYVYYRKPNFLVSTENGDTIIEGGDPAYYYNHMLAQRYRASRNWPAYQTALRDGEEALKGMKLKNNSGTFYNPWTLIDNSGTGFGF